MKLSILEKELPSLRVHKVPLPPYDSLEVEAQPIITKRDGKAKTIPAQTQLAGLKRFGGSLQGSYTFCVSSPVHDGYAKFIGSWWFLRWLEQQKESPYRPTWHTINGSYYDHLRDHKPKASGIIITGVVKGSSMIKLEKLRDILEIYNSIPRLVLTSDEDPITLFNQLKLPLNSCIWLGSNSKRKMETI